MKIRLPLLLGLAFISALEAKAQTALPRLHTIKEDSIATVTNNLSDQSLTITLKSGVSYHYKLEDWDLEDRDPGTAKNVKESINEVKRIYTRVEVAPQFPGGEDAWNNYLVDFCRRHKDDLPKHNEVAIFVQFTVHANGQLTDIRAVSQSADPKLADLAVQALQEGPKWNCATQNGYKVICFKVLPVKLHR